MELQVNQVVKNKRGDYGIVVGFNGKPCLVVYANYVNQLTRFNEDLSCKNSDYSIVRIFDGTPIENFKSVFLKSFNAAGLKVLWEAQRSILGYVKIVI